MLNWIKSLFKEQEQEPDQPPQKQPASPYAAVKVWFDQESAWVHWPEKEPASIAWDTLIGVAVETTDQGPLVEDVWWHLATKEQVLTYPSEATGAKEILDRLQQIPTFNNESLIQAMTCTNNQTFILWDKEGRHL